MTFDGANTLTYDAEGRAVSSTNGTSSGTYTYDGNGLRVISSSGSTTTVYIFSGGKVIAEYDNGAAPSSPSREYIYSGSQLLATISGGATTYHHPDHLSVRLSTDSSANVTRTFGHFPFGEAWYETGTASKWKFTSRVSGFVLANPELNKARDTESNNDYALARFYSNPVARFTSPDPLAGSLVNPQSLNRYSYVSNDPLNAIDPSGLTCFMADDQGNDSDIALEYYTNKSDCTGGGGVWIEVDTTVTVNANATDDTSGDLSSWTYLDFGSDWAYLPSGDFSWSGKPQESYADCVKNDSNYFGLQHGLQGISGGRLGNGIVSKALLGSSVSDVINLAQGAPYDYVAGKAIEKAIPFASKSAASVVPDFSLAAARTATLAVQTPSVTASVTITTVSTINVPTGTLARAGADALNAGLEAFSNWKFAYDSSVSSFSAVVCSTGR